MGKEVDRTDKGIEGIEIGELDAIDGGEDYIQNQSHLGNVNGAVLRGLRE